jgi:putative acetyltransferase
VVARLGGQPIGCGALRRIDEVTAEVKRVYVAPSRRRRGIARRILHALEQLAAGFNYRAIRLGTGIEQPEAIRLYESSGYHRIAAYGHYIGDPLSVCFEKFIFWPIEQLYEKNASVLNGDLGAEKRTLQSMCSKAGLCLKAVFL